MTTALDLDLKLRVDALYADYVACLDSKQFEAWPEFFADDCLYRVVARENWERSLPLSTIALESKRMLQDRVFGATSTLFHDPYYQRHLVSGVRTWREDGVVRAEANYLVVRTKLNCPSEVFNTGRYLDRLSEVRGAFKFVEKICVYDSELVPNSLIYPI